MAEFIVIISAIFDRTRDVLMSPLDPQNRIYWLYLLTSAAAAYAVYRTIRGKKRYATEIEEEDASGTFLQFLFPKRVWSHPSAWLDLRYALFHKVVSHFLLLGVTGAGLVASYSFFSGGQSLSDVLNQENATGAGHWAIAIFYMFVAMLILDLIAWTCHYLQHKVPLLWQFHKVHHSAEVMHPVSNFREHPIDNLLYTFTFGLGYGAIYACAVRWFGFLPTMPTLLGVPVLMFLFNIVGYNLRHSHVWLRWPGRWSAIFPSPAHHHVHHSCHPDHIDKNFAFMFPVWDVIFGTYTMPQDNRHVKFGVPVEQGRDLDGVLRLYWVPFRDAYRLFVPKRKPELEMSDEEPGSAQIPAE